MGTDKDLNQIKSTLPLAKETYKYRKGSRIVCPNTKCKCPIGTLRRALKVGDYLLAKDINYYDHDYKKGENATCKKCGSIWGMNTSKGPLLFINNGWVNLPLRLGPRLIKTMPKPAVILPKK